MALPFFNPDVFWHLSAGRWIWAHGAVPRADPFSFTRYGARWIDFEWGTQLVWYAAERLGGLWGLWALKIPLLAAAFWPVDGLLRDKGASRLARAGALALWLAAMLAQADLRADLASLLFFSILLRRLESGRASFLFGFGLFALWANLHAGFVLAFGLYALYALAARPRPRDLGAEAGGAFFGSLLNPYGLRLYAVLRAHAAAGDPARAIMEWAPPSWRQPFQLPLLAAAAVVLAAAWAARRRAPRALLAAGV
ncbi:MAG: hypothetical protein KGM24_00980, partial [Elusimicrobia bacterium]|nr:hypothetical protein [Elusimicrobiota bacterium]